MRSLITPIQERLKPPQLTGWAVRKYTESSERKSMPAIEISFAQAQAEDSDNRPVGLARSATIECTRCSPDDSDEACSICCKRLSPAPAQLASRPSAGQILGAYRTRGST